MSSPIQNDEMNTGMITSRTPGATVAVRMSRGGGRERDGTRTYTQRQVLQASGNHSLLVLESGVQG